MSRWFDIGVNLTDKRLADPGVMRDAQAAGVSHMAITGTSLEGSIAAANLAREHPQRLFATAGIHPHYAADAVAGFVDRLRQLACRPEVVAIGECGLDFNRNFSAREDQLRVFEQQLALACELKMPLFLHERDAFEPQLRLLDTYRADLHTAVAHCFTGTRKQMEAYLERGLYIGITGWLCDPKRGKALRDAVAALPLDRVVLETDAPYLMPKTLSTKSRTNVPANLPHIAQHVAQCMQVSPQSLATAAWNNSLTLFGLNDGRID